MGTGRPQGAFAALHERHRERIRRYLERLTRDRALAEDLTQETFLRASRALDRFRGEARPSTWLYRIATNLYRDERRRQARAAGSGGPVALRPDERADGDELLRREAPGPDRLVEDVEMGSCIRGFVDELPPAHRAAIVLHDLEGLTNPEIAKVLGCSLETVKIRVHRARTALRKRLDEGCDLYRDERAVLRCDRKPPAPRGKP